ncbi:MAG: shikimate kinase [Fervidicoccaceae archaeon]
MKKGVGGAHGALSFLNAIPTGVGAAVGVNLRMECEVELLDEPVVVGKSRARGAPVELESDVSLSLLETLRERFGYSGGLRFSVESEIPVAKGMKSSTALLGCLLRGWLDAMSIRLDLMEEARLVVEIARRARLTLTGALDDALATLGEGLFVTNNSEGKLLRHLRLPKMQVVALVPRRSIHIREVDKGAYERLRNAYEEAVDLMLAGKIWGAASLNGLLTSLVAGVDPEPILRALLLPRTACAGVTGKGPTIFAVTDDPGEVIEAWQGADGEVLLTRLRG